MSPAQNHSPSSPESDLDVDSAPDEVVPENLSLKKKERSKSPAVNNNFNNNLGFLPYQQSFQPNLSTSPSSQRSPVDVLLRLVKIALLSAISLYYFSPFFPLFRVFPSRRRNEIEQILTRYRGDVVQAMEAILCGDEAIAQIK